MVELRLTKTQLKQPDGAVFYINAAPSGCLSCVFVKHSSTIAEAAFEIVQAAALGILMTKKKKKKGLKLELRLLNAAPTFTELRLIKRSFISYGATFYETQL